MGRTRKIKFSVVIPTRETVGQHEPPPGIKITHREVLTQFDHTGLSILTLIVSFSSATGAGMVSRWLYERFIKPSPEEAPRQVKINEKVVTVVTAEKFQQVIEREITETKGNAPSK